MTHWPVLLFIARLTKSTFGFKLAQQQELRKGEPQEVHPCLSQYLFQCQPTQLISGVFTGGRYQLSWWRIKPSLDSLVTDHSIGHSTAPYLWNTGVSQLLGRDVGQRTELHTHP